MKLVKLDYTQLEEMERRFQEEVQMRSPQILADIFVSSEEVEKLGRLIGNLLRQGNSYKLRLHYPLCTSLFLVWCTVYHYKEGLLWEPIFSQLNVEEDAGQRKFLGDLFLATLSQHRFQLAPEDHGKRYMTPLLMHGYISNYYTERVLDYLYAIYTSYLQYDVTAQALDELWSDLFNFSQEQSRESDAYNKLVVEEKRLKQAVAELQVPEHLTENARQIIDELYAEMQLEKESIASTEESSSKISTEIQEMEALYRDFRKFEQPLEILDRLASGDSVRTEDGIGYLSAQVASAFASQLGDLRDSNKELLRKLKSSYNRYAIARDKRANLMTEVVKLGQGSLVDGYSVLDEYKELKTKLYRVNKQRQQRESLLSYNQEFGNTSARQILTASLTTLGLVNPALFQDFIKSTLRMLDNVFTSGNVKQGHRMTEPIQRWYYDQKNRTNTGRAGGTLQVLPKRAVSEQAVPTDMPKSRSRVSRVRLKSPNLIFDVNKRQLILAVPEQDLPMLESTVPKFSYTMDYGDWEEELTVAWQVSKNQLFLGALEVPITSPNLRSLRFRYHNLFEDWHLKFDEVMVFDIKGNLQSENQLSNGFYYIMVRSGWQTDCDFLVDHYSCNVSDYLVYEVQLAENRIRFFSADEKIIISASRYSGISLSNARYIPGFTQEGIPVAKGSPRLVINKVLLEANEPEMVLELHHNGSLLHSQNFREVVRQHSEELNPQVVTLDLECLVRNSYWKPYWETFEVQIKDVRGNIVFEKAVCIVRGLSISYEAGQVKVEIPRNSTFNHPDARREGTTYFIPIENETEVAIQVYFPRIGWKEFAIEVPGGVTELISADGEVKGLPLAILPSQSDLLGELTVRFKAHSKLVSRVRVTDSAELLSLNFNLSKGSVDIPLRHFSDMFQRLEEKTTIALEWEGKLDSHGTIPLVDVFPRIDVDNVSIFKSEQDDEYLLELSLVTEFPVVEELRFRLWTQDSGQMLFDRRIRSNPDHFYLQRSKLSSLNLNAEIYYSEEVSSVFGKETLEQVCWSNSLQLPNRKGMLKKAVDAGIALKNFKYDGRSYALPKLFFIEGISISAQQFEGEELLRGHIQLESGFQEVFFYIDTEKRIIPFLRDADYDGVQYDPNEERIFWEMHSGANIMGPLDDISFKFIGEDE